ncbi:MAG: pyridoxal 5'-phosphate synthase glutaminase subunit PdxT, partial [SAR202 cluster bacterium]|nr:pyridoxal 5'-phosphate synthase glutaminase subunit PdxT [SAR202 cluster bacterium]
MTSTASAPGRTPTPVTWSLATHKTPVREAEGRVGVLALQGDFLEHEIVLRQLGVPTTQVRKVEELERLDGLIIPGGESTTMAILMDTWGLRDAICRRAREGMAVWGSCAGLILIASSLRDRRPTPLGLMDIHVARNAFGRQVDSFESDLGVAALGDAPFHAVFIRAPVILSTG